jgi:plastocyanin
MKKWSIPVLIGIVALLMPMSTVSVSAQDELSISKSADPTSATVGDIITYTYIITNTDNVTINDLTLEDDPLGSIDLGGQNSIATGENITATATYTVVEADLPGPLVNTATVSGTDLENNQITASATASVELTYSAGLQLTKTADPTSATVGDNITYTYTITNINNVTISNISLNDDKLGPISDNITLAPGENITATATYTVSEEDLEQGSIVNTATATGTDPVGNEVTDDATATVGLTSPPPDEVPAIEVTKSVDKNIASAGDTITYTYTITNTDNVTISNISLDDDKLGPIISDNITLAPGENITATATYTVSEEDLEQGSIVNIATATGTDPEDKTVTANDTATVKLYKSGLQVTKEADSETASFMETITYTYTITNTGDVTISNISLEDDKLGPISDNITLAPGENITVTATHTVSIGDFMLRSTIVNTADATGVDPQGKFVTASDTATVSISKTLFWKRDILKQSGVPGKGIEKAPGLQKPFNPKSQAAEHAGKKDKPKTPEQLQIRKNVENQGTEQQLQIQLEVENEAGSGQATQNDDEAGPGKGQLKKNQSTDNQTQGQEATTGNSQNKPDKDKPKKNPKAGNKP